MSDQLTAMWQLLAQQVIHFRLAFGLIAVLAAIDVFRNGWRASCTMRMAASVWGSLGMFVVNTLCIPLIYVAADAFQAGYDSLGVPHLDSAVWQWAPAWMLPIIAVVAYDLVDYCAHRAMHTHWLWPIHAIHHSDQEVVGPTAFRVHFLELIFMRCSYVLLLSWLGFPSDALGWGAAFMTLHVVYVHADLPWDHGPFKLLLASPRFHRWHHADVPAAHHTNLANIIPLFDYLFGTYHEPSPCPLPMGAKNVPHGDVLGLTVYPFMEWSRRVAVRFQGGWRRGFAWALHRRQFDKTASS